MTRPDFPKKTSCRPKIAKNRWKLRFLAIFSSLKFFKFFYIVNLDNLDCLLAFAINRRSKRNLFRVLTAVNMRKTRFLAIFSNFKFFKFFYILNIVSGHQYKAFATIRKSKKNYFGFWRPPICEKRHFWQFFQFEWIWLNEWIDWKSKSQTN